MYFFQEETGLAIVRISAYTVDAYKCKILDRDCKISGCYLGNVLLRKNSG